MRDTRQKPNGKSLEYCMRFAETLVRMESDRERSQVTVRHCLAYAEAAERPVSHGTFYNDPFLKAMLDWACGRAGERKGGVKQEKAAKAAKPCGEDERKVKDLEKKLKAMGRKVFMADNMANEYQDLRVRNAKNQILLQRAEKLLSSVNMLAMLDMNIDPAELASKLNADNQLVIDENTGDVLERPKAQKIESQ